MSEFFAGVNTEKGFVGYMEQYFAPLRKVYVIKGTAGSGKSTLMKGIAADCFEKGIKTDLVYCSSDTSSLDGVILPEYGSCICDGTAPHVIEPSLPVVRDILVDTAAFVRGDMLNCHSVTEHSKRKKEWFAKLKHYLNIAVSCAEVDYINKKAAALQSLYDFAKAFYKRKLYSSLKGGAYYRVANAFTPDGVASKTAFDNITKVYFVKGSFGESRLFLNYLASLYRADGLTVTLCPHPYVFGEIGGIYFHGSGVYVTLFACEGAKTLRISRYFAPDSDENVKQTRSVCKNALNLAGACIKNARAEHALTEKEYISAMDFSHMGALKEKIIYGMLS